MKKLRIIIPVIFLMLFACKETTKVTTGFKKEISTYGNLSFDFDADMVESDKINKWDTTEYIIFEPAIKGKFKWITKRKLIFSPYNKLKPATGYTATFSKPLKRKKLDTKEINFHTAYVKITSSSAKWALNSADGNKPYLKIDLSFNYNIMPAEVAKFTEIKIGEKTYKATAVGGYAKRRISLVLNDVPLSKDDLILNLTVKKGLETTSKAVIKEDIAKIISVKSPAIMSIQSASASHDGYTGYIEIFASQTINKANIKDFIEISPKVNFTIETNNNNFKIRSKDFDIKKKYELTISKGLSGMLGGNLKYAYTQSMAFGKLRPSISFVNGKGAYLMSGGFKNMELDIVNVEKLKVKISKVYENNIISYFKNSSYRYYDYDYDYEYNSDNAPGNLGDVIWEASYETSKLPGNENRRKLKVDFKDKIGDYNGFYVVEAYSETDYWVKSRKAISISDIGIIAKEGKNSIAVFANSIKTANSMQGVKLSFRGANNQVVGEATTDKDGVAIFQIPKEKASGFRVALITAKNGDDFNYLPFSRTKINTSRFDVGGKTVNYDSYDAYIYGERTLYRPGETINFSAILRDTKWKPAPKIPVKIKVVAPNGKNFKTLKKTLNEQGSFAGAVKVPASGLTGTYSVEVYTSNDILLNSKQFFVEEFMPDRIKAKMTFSATEIEPKDTLKVDINAQNLFGTPAVNRNYEITQRLSKQSFRPKGFEEYNFSISGTTNYFDSKTRNGKTDEKGLASEKFTPNSDYKNMGVLRASYNLAVFDETGRPIHRSKSAKVYTQKTFYGLSVTDYYNSTGKRMKIPVVAVSHKGKALTGEKAKVIIIRHDYKTVLSKSGSYYRYKSEHEEVEVFNKIVTLNGKNSFVNFTPEKSGKFEVRITRYIKDAKLALKNKAFVESSFYAYGYGNTSNSSFKVNSEGNIDIITDKKSYNAGEKAKVMLKTPFPGKVLITVESENVIEHFYKETDKKAVEFEISIKKNFVPNVYISATLFRKHTVSELPLTVAHGFAPIKVENPSNKLLLKITAKTKTASRKTQRISVKTAPGAFVTISAVDEGILLANSAQPADPYGHFYAKRRLGVSSHDIYPFLLPEINMKSGKAGGGDGGEDGKRLNPLSSKRVKLVSFWSGILKADASGKVNFDIDVPQFSGNIKIEAVAYKNHAFSAEQKDMTVADNIVISTGLPRFLSPGDVVEVPVTVSNTTKNALTFSAGIKAEGKIDTKGESAYKGKIKANSEQLVKYKVVAKNEIGQSKVRIDVSAGGKKYFEEIDITVRPASPLQKVSTSGLFKGGESKTLSLNTADFMKQSIERKLIIGNSPLIEFSEDLAYLLKYPYGCVEQTVSSVFPQLYFEELTKSVFKGTSVHRSPKDNINAAIDKLKLMQLYNGGLSYWQGGGTTSWWGTVYAAHFLTEAKKAGYEVDQSMLDLMYKYLHKQVKKKKTEIYYYNTNKKKTIVPKEAAYSIYVLALSGNSPKPEMNYYKANQDLLSTDSKYLLAAAYALSGDKVKFKDVLPADFGDESSVPQLTGSFCSPIRDQAIALNALIESDPDNQQIGILAKHLAQNYKAKRYLNTQERAFTFLAFGKIAKKAAKSAITATVKSDGKVVGTLSGNSLTLNTKELTSDNITIEAKGKGTLYYFSEAEGISTTGSYIQEDKFIQVRRNFYDRKGNKITGNSFKQNDLVVVELVLKGLHSSTVENVVISDLLPACFEVENPRLATSGSLPMMKKASYAANIDFRDDRVNLFASAKVKEKYFYYTVRAVSVGEFVLAPIAADAMYNGEYHSYHGAGKVVVTE